MHGGPGALPRPIRPDIETQSVPRYLPLSYVDVVGEVHIEWLGGTVDEDPVMFHAAEMHPGKGASSCVLFPYLCEGAYRKSCRVSCFQRYGEESERLAVETRQAGEVLHDQDAVSQ